MWPQVNQYQMNQPPMNQPQKPNISVSNSIQDILQACKSVRLYNDDRDKVLIRLNCFLASIGIGKSFYEPLKCVLFPKSNIFQIYKGICYNHVDLKKPSDGEVSVLFGHSVEQIKDRVGADLANIILGNTGATLEVISLHEVSPNSCVVNFMCKNQGMVIYADEVLKRIQENVTISSQLRNINVFECFKTPAVTEAQVEALNSRPEEGFSSIQWKGAYERNPRKSKMILTSVCSPAELSRRSFLQKKCIEQNWKRIESIESRVKNINKSLYSANSSLVAMATRKDKMKSRMSQLVSHLSTRSPPEDVIKKMRQTYQFVTNHDSFQGPIDVVRGNVSNGRMPENISDSDSRLSYSLSTQSRKMEELIEQANMLSKKVADIEMSVVGGEFQQSQNLFFLNQ